MATLPPNFLDELRARTAIQPLIARTVRLTRSGREQKGCCPFHGEKTPSFYVYDDHYHCFGCGEHGDAITWVMKTDGAGFMEAVETLARQAGLEVPRPSAGDAQAAQQRAGALDVLRDAGAVYRRWLAAPEGRPALDYLRGRGLTDATIETFGLGWSGEGRGALAAALRGQGITTDQLVDAGLMKRGDHGPVDMFFARVMFPIRDRKGAVLSFSGRLLGDGQPKYVNGPETSVFSKRRTLYGIDLARDPAKKGARLLVVEGQMDAIALFQAGFAAVAPLGTALTEEQLAEIWRLTPEPIICFDADAAGRRAALKAADLVLGNLAPDRGLGLLRLPDRDDPDSLIRREGAAAFAARLASARPISAALYDMLAEGAARATPEGRAAFRQRLVDAASRIPDRALAGEYRAMWLQRYFDERRGKPRKAAPTAFDREAVAPDHDAANRRRCQLMTAFLLDHPEIFPNVEEAFAHLPLPPPCARLRDALHDYAGSAQSLDSSGLRSHLVALGLEEDARRLDTVAALDYRPDPGLQPADAAKTWWGWYVLMDFSIDTLRRQRDEQQDFWTTHQDDQAAWSRLVKYNELLRRAEAGEYGDPT